jgi:ribonuclease J
VNLKIIPLGGLGEIGMNAMVVETAGRRLLIDCGLLFPRLNRGLGFEVLVPDLSYLLDGPDKLDGVVLTHGHEDHLGALPVLLRDLKVPVWGGPFSLALLDNRLRELGVDADLRTMNAGGNTDIGPFNVEAIHVNHSIPDAFGLAIRGDFGTVVHTGDFKVDPTPTMGKPTDLAAFQRAGGPNGALCLLSDSTNAERPGTTPSEQTVAQTLRSLMREAKGRVIVTMFASHLVRLQQLVELAAETGRKLVVTGRSMTENLRIGKELGHIRGASAVVVEAEQLPHLKEHEVLIATTGAQGEPRSGMWKMAFDAMAPIRVRPGDTVVFSARPIPGNEVGIHDLINRLWEQGATVVTDENNTVDGPVHCSGHASNAEQTQILDAVRPQTFVPIHGEARQLVRHIRVARQSASAPQCVLARDGDVIHFEGPGQAHVSGHVPFGRIALEKRGGSIISDEAIAQRQGLAEGGLVNVVLLVEKASGQLLRSPELSGIGLAQDDHLLLRAREVVRDELSSLSGYARRDPGLLREAAERGVVRSFRKDGERRPMVHAVLIEV